jgi:hypothetical protein
MSYSQKINAARQVTTFALTVTGVAPSLPSKDGEGKIERNTGGPVELSMLNEFTVTTRDSTQRIIRRIHTIEKGEKPIITRYSNKEILEDLVESEVISNISGYLIEAFTVNEGKPSFFLTKRNSPSIDISRYVRIYLGNLTGPHTFVGKEVTTDDVIRDTSTTTVTGTKTGKETLDITFNGKFECYGIYSHTKSIRTFTAPAPNSEKYTMWVPGAARLSSIQGNVYRDSPFPNASHLVAPFVEGSVSFAAGVTFNHTTIDE